MDLLSKIAKEVAESVDNTIAKAFVLEAGRTLREKGIDIWYTHKNIREEVEESDSKYIYKDTYEIHFDSVDTSIHDKKIRDEERSKVLTYLVDNGYIKYGFDVKYLEGQIKGEQDE